MLVAKKKDFYKALLFLASNAMSVLFPIITLPVLTKSFSPDVYGSFAMAAFIGYYISLFVDFGASSYLIAKLSRAKPQKRSNLVFSTFILQFISWVLVSFVFMIFMLFGLGLPWLISMLGVIVGFMPIALPTWLFYSYMSANYFAVTVFLSRLITFICMLYVVNFYNSDLILAFSWLCAPVLISFCFSCFFVINKFSKSSFGYEISWRYSRILGLVFLEHLKARVAGAAYGSFPALLASKFTSFHVSGLYFYSDRIRVGLQMCLNPFSPFFCAKISDAKYFREKIQNLIFGFFLVFIGAFLVFSSLYFFSSTIILFLSNEEYLSADEYVKQMSFVGFFASINAYVTLAVLPALKLNREMITIQVRAAVISLPLVGGLFYFNSITGALQGILLIEFFVSCTSLFCIFKWYLQSKPLR